MWVQIRAQLKKETGDTASEIMLIFYFLLFNVSVPQQKEDLLEKVQL